MRLFVPRDVSFEAVCSLRSCIFVLSYYNAPLQLLGPLPRLTHLMRLPVLKMTRGTAFDVHLDDYQHPCITETVYTCGLAAQLRLNCKEVP